jgi:hypothetical protein
MRGVHEIERCFGMASQILSGSGTARTILLHHVLMPSNTICHIEPIRNIIPGILHLLVQV